VAGVTLSRLGLSVCRWGVQFGSFRAHALVVGSNPFAVSTVLSRSCSVGALPLGQSRQRAVSKAVSRVRALTCGSPRRGFSAVCSRKIQAQPCAAADPGARRSHSWVSAAGSLRLARACGALLRRSVSSFAIILRSPRAAERGPLGPSQWAARRNSGVVRVIGRRASQSLGGKSWVGWPAPRGQLVRASLRAARSKSRPSSLTRGARQRTTYGEVGHP
jgi:hypothetical protein